MSTTVIVVPCYNEAERFHKERFLRFATRNDSVTFVLVNDGSKDRTLQLLMQLSESYPGHFLVHDLPHNVGKAEAVRQGMLVGFGCRPDYVGFWDADLAVPLEAIPKFQDVLDRRPDIHLVLGSRIQLLGHTLDGLPHRRLLGKIFAQCASWILGLRIQDTQCGHKLFRCSSKLESAFAAPFHARWTFDVELLARWIGRRDRLRLEQACRTIYEMPLETCRDIPGSKVKNRDFMRAIVDLATIAAIYWKVSLEASAFVPDPSAGLLNSGSVFPMSNRFRRAS